MSKLHRVRVDKGIPLVKLAAKVGIAPQSLQHLENKQGAEPRVVLAQRLAKALGTSVAVLWPVEEQ